MLTTVKIARLNHSPPKEGCMLQTYSRMYWSISPGENIGYMRCYSLLVLFCSCLLRSCSFGGSSFPITRSLNTKESDNGALFHSVHRNLGTMKNANPIAHLRREEWKH